MSLEPMLEQWSRLEPERCRAPRPRRAGSVRHFGEFSVLLSNGGFIHIDGDDADDHPFLLAAVMEAIEARGWRWACRGGFPSGPTHDARVGIDPRTFAAESSSSAEALLTAYLSAIEAAEGQPA